MKTTRTATDKTTQALIAAAVKARRLADVVAASGAAVIESADIKMFAAARAVETAKAAAIAAADDAETAKADVNQLIRETEADAFRAGEAACAALHENGTLWWPPAQHKPLSMNTTSGV